MFCNLEPIFFVLDCHSLIAQVIQIYKTEDDSVFKEISRCQR